MQSQAVPVALYTPAQRERFRRRLLLFYSLHDPEGSGRISSALTLRVPEATIMAGLYSKYNVSFEQEETAARAKGLLPESAGAGSGEMSLAGAAGVHRQRSATYNAPMPSQQQQLLFNQFLQQQQQQHGAAAAVAMRARHDSLASHSSPSEDGGVDPAAFGAFQQSFGTLTAQSSFAGFSSDAAAVAAAAAAAAAGVFGESPGSAALPSSAAAAAAAAAGPPQPTTATLGVVALPDYEKVRVRRRVERFYQCFFPAGAWKVEEAMASQLPEAELIESLCSSYKVNPATERAKAAELAQAGTEADAQKFQEERVKKQVEAQKQREMAEERRRHEEELANAREEAARMKQFYEEQMQRMQQAAAAAAAAQAAEAEDKKRAEETARLAAEQKRREADAEAVAAKRPQQPSASELDRLRAAAIAKDRERAQKRLQQQQEREAELSMSPQQQQQKQAAVADALLGKTSKPEPAAASPSSPPAVAYLQDDDEDDVPPPVTTIPAASVPAAAQIAAVEAAADTGDNDDDGLSPQQRFHRQQQLLRQLADMRPAADAPADAHVAFLRAELAAARSYNAALAECHKAELQERDAELLARLKDKASAERQLAVESQLSPSRRDLLYGTDGRPSLERGESSPLQPQAPQHVSPSLPRASPASERRYRDRLATMRSTPSSPVRVRGHASPEHPLMMECGVCGEQGRDRFCHNCGAAYSGHDVYPVPDHHHGGTN